MAKLDTDVRNLINHLYFEVSDTWQQVKSGSCVWASLTPSASRLS